MTDTLVIRDIAQPDYDQWLPLWNGSTPSTDDPGRPRFRPRSPAPPGCRFFDTQEPVHALMAERGGNLLGIAHYLFHPGTTAVGPSCYLQDLFTAPALRWKGVGRALIEQARSRVRRAGASRVYWQAHETNDTAMQLYDKVAEKSGFVVYRILL